MIVFVAIAILLIFALHIVSLCRLKRQLKQETERRILAEEQLKIFEQISEAIVAIDKDYKLIAINKKTQEKLEEIFEKKYQLKEKVQEFLGFWNRALKGESFTVTKVFKNKSGGIYYYEIAFNPLSIESDCFIGAVMVARKITERKALEQELAIKKNRLLSTFFYFSPVGLAILDDKLRFVEVNESLAKIENFSVEKTLGKTIREVLPSLAPTLEPIYRQVLDTGNPILAVEITGEHPNKPDAKVYWLNSYCPIFDTEGRTCGVSAFVVDITQRKQAEEKLRLSEKRLAEAQKIAHIGSWEYNVATKTTTWSQELYRIHRLDPDRAPPEVGEMLERIIHPQDKEEFLKEVVNKAKAGQTFEADLRIIRSDGAIRYIEVRGEPIYGDRGQLIKLVGTTLDITERKQTEEILTRYERIVSATTDAISLIDGNHTYQLVNQTYLKWYNKRYEEIVGHSVGEIMGEEVFETIVKPLLDRCLSGETIQYQAWFDYETIGRQFMSVTYAPYFELDQKISGVVVSVRNLTELQQAQQALRQSEERWQLAIEGANEGIWDYDPMSDKLFVSARCLEMLGYDDEQIDTLNKWIGYVHPDDKEPLKDTVKRHLAGDMNYCSYEYRMRCQDGSYKWLLARGQALWDNSGRAIRAVGSLSDVSSRRQTEEALRQLTEELESRVVDRTVELANANKLLQQEIVARSAAQKELARQEQILKSFFQGSPVGLVIYDAQFRCIQINQALAEIDGISVEEHLGRTIDEFIPELAPNVKPLLARVLATGEPIFKLEVSGKTPKQPDIRHWEISYFPVLGEDEQIVAVGGAIVETTERKRTLEALQESEARFRRAVADAPFPIIIHAEDGEILQINRAWTELTGYAPEEIPTVAQWTARAYREGHKAIQEAINKLYRLERRVHEGEFAITTANGENRIWDFSSAPLGKLPDGRRLVISMAKDITKRKRLEESLQKSIQRLENLHQLDTAILEVHETAAIATAAIENIQRLIPCSQITIVIFDLPTQTAKVLSQGEYLKDKEFKLVELCHWQEARDRLQESESYFVSRLSICPNLPPALEEMQKQGFDRFINFPLIASKKLLGVLWLWLEEPEILDITEPALGTLTSEQLTVVREVSNQVAIALNQAHLYEQIQLSNIELEERVALRTAQLEEVNQQLEAFAYSVSHDLRAPLRALQGFASAILEDYGHNLDSLAKEYARRLVTAAEQMDRLILDLLSYSRISRAQLHLNSVSLSLIVTQALDGLQEDLRISQAQVSVEEPLPIILGNQTVLLQVINNLLSNAIKFVDPNVRPVVRIWSEQQPNRVRLWIEDNGIGIKEEHLERIFGVFERLHGSETYPGTGIGLAIVRKGMERLGGSAGVESDPGGGSRFWIEAQACIPNN